jgi:hypothetical protein
MMKIDKWPLARIEPQIRLANLEVSTKAKERLAAIMQSAALLYDNLNYRCLCAHRILRLNDNLPIIHAQQGLLSAGNGAVEDGVGEGVVDVCLDRSA